MQDKFSLQEIIGSVLDDRKKNLNEEEKANYYERHRDNDIRMLRHAFDRLLGNLGTDKELLKTKGNKFEFDKTEVPMMKVIINQLLDGRGLIAEFTNERNMDTKFPSKNVLALINSILDEAEKDGAIEENLQKMAVFYDSIFSYSLLRSIEFCHKFIDLLVYNEQESPPKVRLAYMLRLEHIIKKECSHLILESAIRMSEIAELRDELNEDFKNIIDGQRYTERDNEMRSMYIQRDKQMLEKIQGDDDLRQYIEKKIGKKAEEIFNYANLSDNT